MTDTKERTDIIVEGDISHFKADVIVNSVGIGKGVKTYGAICDAITNVAMSNELDKKIHQAKDIYVLGDFFVTSGYGLPTKYIINLISPYYEFDKDLNIYKDCIRRVLNECRRLEKKDKVHIKTIAIPLVGTGANGYNEQTILNLLVDIAIGFMNTYAKAEYDVKIVKPFDEISENNRRRIERIMSKGGRKDIAKDIKFGSYKYIEAYDPSSKNIYDYSFFAYGLNGIDGKDVLSSDLKNEPKTIQDYVREYLRKKSIRYKKDGTINNKKTEYISKLFYERVKAFLEYDKPDPKKAGAKTLGQLTPYSKTHNFLAIIFACKMSYVEAVSFLEYFGRFFPSECVYPGIDTIIGLIKEGTYDFYEIKEKTILFNKKH